MPSFFPWWVVVTHFLNIFFLLLMARSGLEVLSAMPKFYWHDDCTPGREWLRFSRRIVSADSRRLWTSLDEEESWSPVIALPGRKNLGIGRHWHFLTVPFWILTGAVYIAMVFASGYWHYLIPTEWGIVPDAIRSIGTYLHFDLPEPIPGEPFEPAQKLTYFAVVFLLAPFQIATGAGMSPAVAARFPRYPRIFGGVQGARSLHFLGLCAFAVFTLGHTVLVVINGLPEGLASIVLSDPAGDAALAITIAAVALTAVAVFHIAITRISLTRPRLVQRLTGAVVDPMQDALSRSLRSRQRFTRADISPYHRVNGYPPPDADYERMARDDFREYRLRIGGLVANPVSLDLTELRALGVRPQIVMHHCIQGWTATAEWAGVPMARIVELVRPLPEVRHVVFYAMDDKGLTEGEGRHGRFYGSMPLARADDPQTILALEMNGAPLPIEHGAPVRLRTETQLGFKMVKWIGAIEFVAGYRDIGMGQGGWREDQMYYSTGAGI